MNRARIIPVAVCAAILVTACGGDNAPESAKALSQSDTVEERTTGVVIKPISPFQIGYTVIGTPIVGSPLTIQLIVQSSVAPANMRLDYRNRDESALLLGTSQPARVDVTFNDDEKVTRQQVTIVPQREGRHYLIVSATHMTPTGEDTTSLAVPIQVGEVGRELIESGRLETTESGETVRVLPGN